MTTRILRVACLAAGASLLMAASSWAQTSPEPLAARVYTQVQNKYPDTLADRVRVDLAIKRSGVTTKAMLLDKAERDVFWQAYYAYQQEWARVSNAREALLKEYVATAARLDGARVKEVLAKCFDLEDERIALLRKYAADLQQKLPPDLVVKFVQAELEVQHLTDLQLSGGFPDFR
jgi:hypothetical protein